MVRQHSSLGGFLETLYPVRPPVDRQDEYCDHPRPLKVDYSGESDRCGASSFLRRVPCLCARRGSAWIYSSCSILGLTA